MYKSYELPHMNIAYQVKIIAKIMWLI